ncbi:hypothetical protein JCM24511_02412 [Saitozyma sp. JCM 24511]|nr:hypothetical protein JCM24511_02412 [Saitozyma sp. JCM 24511]
MAIQESTVSAGWVAGAPNHAHATAGAAVAMSFGPKGSSGDGKLPPVGGPQDVAMDRADPSAGEGLGTAWVERHDGYGGGKCFL